MPLSLTNLEKSYGPKAVLNGVSLGLNAGDRIALIGANGSGKSTLLRIAAGVEDPDEGVVNVKGDETVAYLAQTMEFQPDDIANDFLLAANAEVQHLEIRMRELEALMAGAEVDEAVLSEYGEVSDRFAVLGGYDIEARAEEAVGALGLKPDILQRPLSSLSGGQRARVSLARLFLSSPDTLLLDEPTNDLDREALSWLESQLLKFKGGVLFVSHDRDFIDRVATGIVELDEYTHRLTRHEGNYTAYLQERSRRHEEAQAAWDARRSELTALRSRASAVRHAGQGGRPSDNDKMANNARGATSEKARSRTLRGINRNIAQLEEQELDVPLEPLTFRGSFATGALRPGVEAVVLNEVSKQYGENKLIKSFSTSLVAGDRVLLTGQNGAGKSTLLRILAGVTETDSGTVKHRSKLRIGYLPQNPDLPDSERTVTENLETALRKNGITSVTQEARGWLVRWGLLHRNELDTKVSRLSTGQQRKLEIGILIGSQPDILLLDEPTNHISLDLAEAFETAIANFQGPVVIVTHDQRFARNFKATAMWHLDDGILRINPRINEPTNQPLGPMSYGI